VFDFCGRRGRGGSTVNIPDDEFEREDRDGVLTGDAEGEGLRTTWIDDGDWVGGVGCEVGGGPRAGGTFDEGEEARITGGTVGEGRVWGVGAGEFGEGLGRGFGEVDGGWGCVLEISWADSDRGLVGSTFREGGRGFFGSDFVKVEFGGAGEVSRRWGKSGRFRGIGGGARAGGGEGRGIEGRGRLPASGRRGILIEKGSGRRRRRCSPGFGYRSWIDIFEIRPQKKNANTTHTKIQYFFLFYLFFFFNFFYFFLIFLIYIFLKNYFFYFFFFPI
jgi:hypothetical protein